MSTSHKPSPVSGNPALETPGTKEQTEDSFDFLPLMMSDSYFPPPSPDTFTASDPEKRSLLQLPPNDAAGLFNSRRKIAAEVLVNFDPVSGLCQCPGYVQHTKRNSPKDCRVMLDGIPTIHCLHSSCGEAVSTANALLRSRIGRSEAHGNGNRDITREVQCSPKPVPPKEPKYPPLDLARLKKYTSGCRKPISIEWLRERSPVAIPPADRQGVETSMLFLGHCYSDQEKVLVFQRYYSQGCFMWSGGRSWRLPDAQGVQPVLSGLPSSGSEGVWFLTNPVTGDWVIQPLSDPKGRAKWTRRGGQCVTKWKYLLLESDEAPEELWLRALVLLPLEIVGIFTSGGRSLHALVRCGCATKLEMDSVRDQLRRVCGPLGADCAALSAVRLARLPGCRRLGRKDAGGAYTRYDPGRLQQLLWLNPKSDGTPIYDIAK